MEEQEKEARLLRHRASRDELTGFYKKNIFEEKVRTILNASADKSGHAMACIDVDDFKGVNDTLGHLFGDTVFCRFGGDEFCIFFPDIESKDRVEEYVKQVMARSGETFRHGKTSRKVFLSMRIALSQGMDVSYEDLFQSADDALYRSKAEGKNTYCFAEHSCCGRKA